MKVGEIFDERFIIRKYLGAGNFSEVYRAAQQVCGVHLRNVALKVFKKNVNADNAYDVFSEAVMLSRLAEECPSIEVDRHFVHLIDGGISRSNGDCAYLTMEYINGSSLGEAIAKHKGLPGISGVRLELSLCWLNQILIPLAWMHNLEVKAVHGDLHPGNVLVTDKGEIKIVDFGLAARLPAMVLGGAIDYQAPETLLGQPSDTRFDVYAIGLMWYEMLTGQKPFRNEELEGLEIEVQRLSMEIQKLKKTGNVEALSYLEAKLTQKQNEYIHKHVQIRKEPVKPASTMNSELLEYLNFEEILQKCIRYNPGERYLNAAHLKQAIDEYSAGKFRITEKSAESILPKLPSRTPELLLNQAEVYLKKNQFKDALNQADEAINMKPRWYKPWIIKVKIALAAAKDSDNSDKQKYLNMASEYVQKAKELSQQNPEVFETMADVFDANGQTGLSKSLRDSAKKLKKASG